MWTKFTRICAPLAGSDGFSLVEAMVAASILAVVALGSAVGADRAVRHNVYSRSLAAATTLAQSKVEDLKSKVTSHTDLTAGAHADAINPLRPDGTTGGIFTRTWNVTVDTPAAGLKTVQITVSWSIYGDPHTVRLTMVHS
jgi:prepilin-type N-terminal cleavage/methylation domain-containing protein